MNDGIGYGAGGEDANGGTAARLGKYHKSRTQTLQVVSGEASRTIQRDSTRTGKLITIVCLAIAVILVSIHECHQSASAPVMERR